MIMGNREFYVKVNGDYVNINTLPEEVQEQIKKDLTKRYTDTVAKQLATRR